MRLAQWKPPIELSAAEAKVTKRIKQAKLFTFLREIRHNLAQLSVELPVVLKEGARHVVVDSTGVKVYSEGEWKTRYS